MNQKAIEAWNYYKKMFPSFHIFFRQGDTYKVFGDDAENVSDALGVPLVDGEVTFPADTILDTVSKLYESGIVAKLISYRTGDEDSQYEIPDVAELDKERKADR